MEKSFITNQISSSIKVKENILNDNSLIEQISNSCDLAIKTYQKGNKTLIAGNGGSAADAQHIAGEFVSRFYFDRPGLASVAITTDTSILTAIGNDYGYDKIFSRQLEANGKNGDLFIAISTSGNSTNILLAIQKAKEMGISIIGLTGASGGKMKELCDICICVPSSETPRIQESHIVIGHIICAAVEDILFSEYKK
jgi:D-sedoheptulose 7-phosphate isomerase